MYPNPNRYESIRAYQVHPGQWVILGYLRTGPSETIAPGFRNKQVAEAWMNEYLRQFVRQDFEGPMQGPLFDRY